MELPATFHRGEFLHDHKELRPGNYVRWKFLDDDGTVVSEGGVFVESCYKLYYDVRVEGTGNFSLMVYMHAPNGTILDTKEVRHSVSLHGNGLFYCLPVAGATGPPASLCPVQQVPVGPGAQILFIYVDCGTLTHPVEPGWLTLWDAKGGQVAEDFNQLYGFNSFHMNIDEMDLSGNWTFQWRPVAAVLGACTFILHIEASVYRITD